MNVTALFRCSNTREPGFLPYREEHRLILAVDIKPQLGDNSPQQRGWGMRHLIRNWYYNLPYLLLNLLQAGLL